MATAGHMVLWTLAVGASHTKALGSDRINWQGLHAPLGLVDLHQNRKSLTLKAGWATSLSIDEGARGRESKGKHRPELEKNEA